MSKYNNTTFKFVPNDNILDYSPIHECDLSLSEESSSTWIFPITSSVCGLAAYSTLST